MENVANIENYLDSGISFAPLKALTSGLYKTRVKIVLSPPFKRLNGKNAGTKSLTSSERGIFI